MGEKNQHFLEENLIIELKKFEEIKLKENLQKHFKIYLILERMNYPYFNHSIFINKLKDMQESMSRE